jgi:hypothetical protein
MAQRWRLYSKKIDPKNYKVESRGRPVKNVDCKPRSLIKAFDLETQSPFIAIDCQHLFFPSTCRTFNTAGT